MSGVRGWCPGALRPMESGDGWITRIRPHGGRLSPSQAAGIANAARDHGNGLIDLTGRANLQIRGVTPDSHAPLIEALRALDLIDADIEAEQRRNIIVTPFADPETDGLAAKLEAALTASALPLPAKFGFAVDTGPAPVLWDIPADIRLERGADGRLILRADGCPHGAPCHSAAEALTLAGWFLAAGGAPEGRGRMAGLIARGTPPADAILTPAPALPTPVPGPVPQGMLVGLEFGQIEAEILAALAALGPLRMTPWRMLLIEGAGRVPALPGLIAEPDDPRLRLRSCTGAPGCRHAHAPTRALARQLAPHLPKGRVLHVSGCAKGCGWPRAADLTLTATPEGFDLIRGGCASDIPQPRGLPPARLPEVL
ncbi:precorrin-3B synthase [Paracoccus methylarcula]|uniref:Precorrin-3B synthase n=1 Tax=Paracoccus methylarcula TaxID=72022 RepID=A0A422QT89_9RHOB|nr:precorrin-3B synthase [Paracoccus methylarcula]RNF33205.1 precorrin-3B synthase [Paracoccus methylarcula]